MAGYAYRAPAPGPLPGPMPAHDLCFNPTRKKGNNHMKFRNPFRRRLTEQAERPGLALGGDLR